MITTIEERTIKAARKDHPCSAFWFLSQGDYRNNGFTFAEYRAIAKAVQNKGFIKKGEPYIRQRNTNGSEIWTYKAIPEIDAICIKYNYFEDDY